MKSIRQKLGLSIAELASRLAISKSSVMRYENGKRPIPNSIKLALEDMLVDCNSENCEAEESQPVAKSNQPIIQTRYKKTYMDLSQVTADLDYAEVAIKDLEVAECYELAGRVKRCNVVLREVMRELALLDGKALKNIEGV